MLVPYHLYTADKRTLPYTSSFLNGGHPLLSVLSLSASGNSSFNNGTRCFSENFVM